MKTYIFCPRVKTGGPENIHQLCDYINKTGGDCSIYYLPHQDENEILYPEFQHIKIATSVHDAEDTLVIVPEINCVENIQKSLKYSTVAIWWLSYTNAAFHKVLKENIINQDVIHLFHSYFEYVNVRPFLLPTTNWYFATEYIHDDFLALNPDEFIDQKEDLVCFNGVKDIISPTVCSILKQPFLPLKHMNREEIIKTLKRCKIYVDMGYHPGKDHLPREAAMCGCVVITNKAGSAAYQEDVPIEEKVIFEKDLLTAIPKVLENYKKFYTKQASYRDFIKKEKGIFEENVTFFMEQIKNDMLLLKKQQKDPRPEQTE
jgi:hypothetical protein